MKNINPIGDRIKKWLAENGKSQEWLAEKMGCTQTQVNRLVNGSRKWKEYQIVLAQKATGITSLLNPHVNGVVQKTSSNKTHSIIPDGEMHRVQMASELKKRHPRFDRTADLFFEVYKTGDAALIASVELMLERMVAVPEEKPGSAPGKPRRPRAGGSRGRRSA